MSRIELVVQKKKKHGLIFAFHLRAALFTLAVEQFDF